MAIYLLVILISLLIIELIAKKKNVLTSDEEALIKFKDFIEN
jgi:hypothetical protein